MLNAEGVERVGGGVEEGEQKKRVEKEPGA